MGWRQSLELSKLPRLLGEPYFGAFDDDSLQPSLDVMLEMHRTPRSAPSAVLSSLRNLI